MTGDHLTGRRSQRRSLAIVLALVLSFAVVELVAGAGRDP